MEASGRTPVTPESIYCPLFIVIIFSFLSPNFLTPGDIVISIEHASIYAILAIGMSFTILTGGIDLSVGSISDSPA